MKSPKNSPEIAEAKKRMRDAQRDLRRAIRDVKALGGRPFKPPRSLAAEHLKNCRVRPTRSDILLELAKDYIPAGAVTVELGTKTGRFAQEILAALSPKQLDIVDIDFSSFKKDHFEGAISKKIVSLHEQKSGDFLAKAADETYDFIYIDASHDYKFVKIDAQLSAKKLKPGGLMMFNDYILWSHTGAVPYGIVQAVNELCVQDSWEILFLSLPANMFCDVALRKLK